MFCNALFDRAFNRRRPHELTERCPAQSYQRPVFQRADLHLILISTEQRIRLVRLDLIEQRLVAFNSVVKLVSLEHGLGLAKRLLKLRQYLLDLLLIGGAGLRHSRK